MIRFECGEPTECVAAVVFFVEDDDDFSEHWRQVADRDHVYRVWVTDRASFVDRLQVWTAGREDLDGFLAIVAHMGKIGVHPTTDGESQDTVPWNELAQMVDTYVDVLWLIGCSSQHGLTELQQSWRPPRFVAFTTTSIHELQCMQHLFDFLDKELSLSSPYFIDQMAHEVQQGGNGANSFYFRLSKYVPIPPQQKK